MVAKRIKSIGCCLLATVMAVTLYGCTGGAEDIPPLLTLPPGTSPPTQAPSSVASTDDPYSEDPYLSVFTYEQLSQAQIVIPANSMVCDETDGYLYSSIASLRNTIRLRHGFDLPIVEDTAPEKDFEILIGDTNREESYQLIDGLLYHDYGFALCSDKIVVRGGDTLSLKQAIVAFHLKISSYHEGKSEYFYSSRMDTLVEETYLARDTKLNGALLSSYSIVYPTESNLYEKELAERLANRLQILTGSSIAWYDDSTPYEEGAHEFLIGKTNRAFTASTETGAAVESEDRKSVV